MSSVPKPYGEVGASSISKSKCLLIKPLFARLTILQSIITCFPHLVRMLGYIFKVKYQLSQPIEGQ